MPRFLKSRSYIDQVRLCLDQVVAFKQNSPAPDLNQTIRSIKTHIFSTDWDEGTQNQFYEELYRSNLLLLLLSVMIRLDFECKKDVRLLFVRALQRKVVDKYPTVHHIVDKPEVLKVLCSLYESQSDGLNSGPMLRECLNHQQLAKIFLESSSLLDLFGYSDSPTFDLASDAFATLRMSLTVHKLLVSQFLTDNYTKFFTRYENMFHSDNYVTRRQYLNLLSDLLMERSNFYVMRDYISNPLNLKNMMVLLKDKSPTIQFEAFHVFKIFVANPRKPQSILDILNRNKPKLIKLLENFIPDRSSDEQFVQEKEYLLKQIRALT